MPTFSNTAFGSYFNRILQLNRTGNNGTDGTTRSIQTGDGVNTCASISDDVFGIQPQDDNTAATCFVKDKDGDNILAVNTNNSKVLVGASQIAANTQFKEMGLFDFSPTAGYHNPLIANNMMFSDSGADIIEDQSMFSNGTDPAATLDLSANGTPMIAVACYWYIENNITLDSVRYMCTTDSADTLDFHLESYTLDNTTNFGDLSAGLTCAHLAAVTSDQNTARTGLLALASADIDAGKVVIGFVESDSTTDITCTLNIKYHIR